MRWPRPREVLATVPQYHSWSDSQYRRTRVPTDAIDVSAAGGRGRDREAAEGGESLWRETCARGGGGLLRRKSEGVRHARPTRRVQLRISSTPDLAGRKDPGASLRRRTCTPRKLCTTEVSPLDARFTPPRVRWLTCIAFYPSTHAMHTPKDRPVPHPQFVAIRVTPCYRPLDRSLNNDSPRGATCALPSLRRDARTRS
jgi:hypothetical protein